VGAGPKIYASPRPHGAQNETPKGRAYDHLPAVIRSEEDRWHPLYTSGDAEPREVLHTFRLRHIMNKLSRASP